MTRKIFKVKLHKALFYLLILFIPVQLGKHFWPDWTMVNGIRTDYLSPTIYFTDILILGILGSWIAEKLIVRTRRSRVRTNVWNFSLRSKNKRLFFLLLGLLVFLPINCFLARNQPAAFYKLIKIIEFGLLSFYVAKNMKIDKVFNYSIAGAVVYSSLIAIVQFLKQGSIGGVFYWLGERTFNAGTPGIAQIVWNGKLLLRPYATFPHPNVLAGFLVISLLFIIFKNRQNTTIVVFCPIILGIIALFLTFSRVAWAVFVLEILVLLLCCHCEPRPWRGVVISRLLRRFPPRNDVFKFIGLFVVLVFIGSISTYFAPIQPESITYRQDLNVVALKMWQSPPLVGVGLNNFLVRLPEFYRPKGPVYFLQPAHNLFLMIAAEIGAIGLIGVIWGLILTIRHLLFTTNYLLITILFVVLALSLFDHYFYTLQQGQILLTIVLGLSWSSISTSSRPRRESRSSPSRG